MRMKDIEEHPESKDCLHILLAQVSKLHHFNVNGHQQSFSKKPSE
jgi:hypothetical protein